MPPLVRDFLVAEGGLKNLLQMFEDLAFLLMDRRDAVFDDVWIWLEQVARWEDDEVLAFLAEGTLINIVTSDREQTPGDWWQV